ncbi:retrovirus-related Pol polyprotein from transposon TNT 1-94 [Caerostris darwini]|uniref:Retrovirus-related Pol polyprotein from transposon TNT 1-94 n=1 Tax=Caerostris darwini TaxID=1538125 RepID=A0AAV4U7J4_9ARAC|nr:retrovirus-related Pol polyprotein from transposon TNT 1-94 [Caerostris darwini]
MVICFPLQENFQVFEYFKTFQANAERVLNRKIISGRCDNGIEFCHNKFSKCLNDQGISCEETNTYSAEQNGVSERFNLTAMDCVEAMLNESGVGKCFGGRGIEFRVKEPLTSYDYDDDSNDSNRPEKTTISDDLDQGSPNFPALGPYCLRHSIVSWLQHGWITLQSAVVLWKAEDLEVSQALVFNSELVERRNGVKKNGFSFTWIIENFDYCWDRVHDSIKSPPFIVNGIDNTKWRLVMGQRFQR